MTDSDSLLKRKPESYDFPFDADLANRLRKMAFGENWPVVYILNNETEAYIGETSSASSRMNNHWTGENSQERQRLRESHIIYCESFNKSVILDLESELILLMTSDGKYQL